jgi:DNA repair protein RecO (recombination protein O)
MPKPIHTLRAEVIVLRHTDWGEADRLLVLYSRENGKLRAIAKGIRKIHSRKAGHLEPFTRAAVLLAHGRDFWIVTQAETVDSYPAFKEDLVRLGYASFIVELLDRFTYEEGENRALYQLLVETLKYAASEGDAFNAVLYYQVRLLDLLGFRPLLFECARCGKEIKQQDQFFSALDGGVVCPECSRGLQGGKPVSMRALRILRHYQRSSYEEARRVNIAGVVRSELETLLQYDFTYLLERGLNTPDFLKKVRRAEM